VIAESRFGARRTALNRRFAWVHGITFQPFPLGCVPAGNSPLGRIGGVVIVPEGTFPAPTGVICFLRPTELFTTFSAQGYSYIPDMKFGRGTARVINRCPRNLMPGINSAALGRHCFAALRFRGPDVNLTNSTDASKVPLATGTCYVCRRFMRHPCFPFSINPDSCRTSARGNPGVTNSSPGMPVESVRPCCWSCPIDLTPRTVGYIRLTEIYRKGR